MHYCVSCIYMHAKKMKIVHLLYEESGIKNTFSTS